MRTPIGPVVLVALASFTSPWPAGAEVVPLEALEARALGERPALEARRQRTRRARAALEIAESASRPSLGLGLDASVAPGGTLAEVEDVDGDRYLVSGSQALGDGGAFDPNFRYGATLRLDATIADFGRTAAATRAARAERSAARAEEQATRAEIVARVRSSYLAWIAAHELVSVAEQTAAAAAARRARVETLVEEGARPESDRAPIRSDEALARLELARAQGRLRQARLVLEEAVGAPLPGAAEPDRTILTRAPAERPPPAEPAVLVLQRQREAARQNARAAERQASPVLSGRAEAGVYGQFDSLFPAYRVGLSLAVPLWDGGRQAAQASALRASAAELDARARDVQAARDAADERARADVESAEARLTIAGELVEACETRLRQAEERYDLGAGSIEAIAEARTTLLRARSEVVLARVDRAAALLRLAR